MKKDTLTLTIVSNMTSNYGEGQGNIASVQKIFKNKNAYSIRTKESLKNAIMMQSGLYDDLRTDVDGATQKLVNSEVNASNCRALEGGYMSTKLTTNIRKSSFYLTDAISCESFVNETRFHNNLFLANNYAKANNINIQEKAKEVGLMPYQYEYEKSLKVYSITIDLSMIGKDENFTTEENYKEAEKEEKAFRVNSILNAIEDLSLVVKGSLDNASPIFVVGGFSERKTHYFENVVRIDNSKLVISKDLIGKVNKGYYVGLLESKILKNESEIKSQLNSVSIMEFFDLLKKEVNNYFGIS